MAAPKLGPRNCKYLANSFDFLVPRVISCSPFQAPTLVCCLLFEVSMLVPFWGQLWRTMVSRASSSLPTLASSRSKRQTLRLPMISLSASVVLPGLSGNRGVCAPEPTSKSSVLQLPDGKVCEVSHNPPQAWGVTANSLPYKRKTSVKGVDATCSVTSCSPEWLTVKHHLIANLNCGGPSYGPKMHIVFWTQFWGREVANFATTSGNLWALFW